MKIFLCGLPRTGKTTSGRMAAQELGYDFVDLDEHIERLYALDMGQKKKCRQIYAEKGECCFRRYERQALESLELKEHTIVALGGGALESPENRSLVRRKGKVFFLDAPELVAWERLGDAAFLDPKDPRASFSSLAQRRQQQYRDCSDVVIAVEELTPQQVATVIVTQISVVASEK